jgi:hypothetical protein
VHVLHGHVHRELTRRLCGRNHAQVFAAPAVRLRDPAAAPAHVRLYKAEGGKLHETVVAAPLLQPLAARPALLAAPAYA